MTLTFRALCYLHAFEHRLPVPDGLAFDSLLRTTRLDYSVQSLQRIDVFLDALRSTRKMTGDSHLKDPAVQNLLMLLAFYVGEVIGRSLGAQPHWSAYEEVAAQERPAGGPVFETSATLSFPGSPAIAQASFRPLVAITSRLFSDPVNTGVLSSAGLLLAPEATQKPASLQPLPPLPAPAWPVDLAPGLVEIAPPAEAVDGLRYLLDNVPALLREGRVVWGAVVHTDSGLFEPGPETGAPGDILYDPRGRVPDADLHAMARTLVSLRGRRLNVPELEPIAQYLTDESLQVFGLDLPASFSAYPLKVASTWFDRAQLPGGLLAQALIPVLVSDAHPGAVLPLPAACWPAILRQAWSPAGLPSMADDLVVGAAPAAYVPDSELAHLEPSSLAEEGLLWFRGDQVAQDYGKARLAWSKSAATGDAAGLDGLGQLYEQGLGVEVQLKRALDYYDQGAAKNSGPAREGAQRVRRQLASRGSFLSRILRR